MAEATGLRNNGLPYPVYGAPWGVAFPILDADGDLVTGAASLDSEISKNGDTFADCTNEATEIATSSGVYYLLLTATEMTADVVSVIVKTSTSGAKTTTLTLYPRKLVPLRTGTSAGGAVGYITLDASAGALDDMWNGCLCVAVIDSVTEARIIDDYTGSNQQASVTPDWNTAPDADDTFTIYLPEGRQFPTANLSAISGVAVSTSTAQLGVNVVQAAGTAWGSGAITAASIADGAIDAATFAAGAIDAAAIAANAIDFATFAADCKTGTGLKANVESISANAITATAINADAITAAKVAADVHQETIELAFTYDATAAYSTATAGSLVKEVADNAGGSALTAAAIADAVWDEASTGHTDAGKAGAQVWTDIDAILADTGTDGVVVAAASKTGYALSATQSFNLTGSITGNLSGSVGSVTGAVGSVTGAVGSVTGNVGGNVAGSVGSVTGAVGSVTGNVGGNVTGSVGSVASGGITAASIATGAIDADALTADAVAEIWSQALTEATSVPAATASVLSAIGWVYLLARNKIEQTASTQTAYADNGSTPVATAGVTDDGTTFTRAEWS